MVNFSIYYPYALIFAELLVRYFLAAASYLFLGTALWTTLHGFFFGKSLKAFFGGILLGSAMIFWPLAVLPYLHFLKFPVYLALIIPALAILFLLNRYLWRRVRSISPEEKSRAIQLLPYLVAVLLIGTSIFSWWESNSNRDFYSDNLNKLKAAEERISEIQNEATSLTNNLSKEETFTRLFKEKNFAALSNLTQEEINKSNLINALAVTDKNGITVVSPHNPLLINRNLTTLGPAHVRILKGEPAKTFELGITTPLVVGAGTPILESNEVIGAVFAARLIDRNFVLELAQRVGASDLGIYCVCNKIYLSTFDDPETNKALQNFTELYFTGNTLQENKKFTKNLAIAGKTLTTSGQVLTDENGKALGLLMVFISYPPQDLLWSLKALTALATGITILLFFSPLILHRHNQ